MINIKSSFSTKLIVDILAIKFSTKSLPNDLKSDMIQEIKNIEFPKISQYDIQQIQDQANEEKTKVILTNLFLKFQYNITLLNDIGTLDILNMHSINYTALIVMYSYISWIIHIEDLKETKEVKPLLSALLFVTKSQYSNILMNITISVISEFCLYDDEMNIYDLMPIIWEYVNQYQCYDLVINVIKHVFKDQNNPEFHHFMDDLVQFIDKRFSDKAVIQILQQFNRFTHIFNINSLKYLIKISDIVKKQILPLVIPVFPIAIFDISKTLPPIVIKNPNKSLEAVDCYQNSSLVIGEFEFSKVQTLPNGFDPSFSISFPKLIDLSTFFPENLSQLYSQIAGIIQNDDTLIDIFISSFFKTVDENDSSDQGEFNMINHFAFLFICNEINKNAIRTISIKPENAIRFFQHEIFDYSVSIFNYQNNEYSEFYQKINTLRSISLDYILYDDALSIETILVSNAYNYPNFIAELFFRLSKMSSILVHCIIKNPKLIKAIINLAISYHHLEITIESDNKSSIRNARISIFVTLAHLFSDHMMLILFFNDALFLNTFFIFLFEEPVRPFILSTMKLLMSKLNIPLPTEFPSMLYRVFNILNLNLSGHRHLLLLNDLISTLNAGLTYRQKELFEFRETCKILCQTMVKINISESDLELSKKIFKETISFLILMSPFFEISALEIDALIACVLSFNDQEFIDSLFSTFISLLAGQPVSPNSTNIVILQPQIFTLLIRIFYSTSNLTKILKFIYNVISFTPKNLQKCWNINLDLFILKYLENAKKTNELSDDEVQAFLDLYSLLSLQNSSSQSVLSYISLLSPIDSNHVSKYHLKFIETMDQMVIESSKMPRSTFPLNGRVMHVASSSDPKGKVDFSAIEKGFSVAFWIFVEPTLECNRIFSLKIGDKMKIGIVFTNNGFLVYQRENHITNTKSIPEELKLHTWTFCAFTFTKTNQRIIVQYLLKQTMNEARTMNIVPIENFRGQVNSKKASLKLGGFYQLMPLSTSNSQGFLDSQSSLTPRSNSVDSSTSSFQNGTNSPCRLGSFGLFKLMEIDKFIEIARINLQNSSNLPLKPIVYVNDYSEHDETVANGFVDVLACQSGVNMLLPLFLQNDMKTFDDKPFHLSLETIITLLMHVLTYSIEAQTNFFQSKGFNIIAQLLTDRWTSYFTIKTHNLLYQILLSIQYEPLQQQIFDEVMTNFTFIQKLDPDLHFRIVKHWPPLFSSFSSIAQNFSSFEDIMVILRLFYWYKPVQTQYIKYVELRSDKLKVEQIRHIIFGLLFTYASESFQFTHFQCIISHILSCPELDQIREMIAFLTKVFSETPDSIEFNVECEPLIALISYFIRYPDENIRIQVLNFFIILHHVKKISDVFFLCQLDALAFILPDHAKSRVLFDFLIDNVESEPLLLNLCCYLAVYFKDASFMHQKKIKFNSSRFWAVMPLFVSIYVDESVTDLILESGINDLCDIFIQYDIFFERSKSFESVFYDKLLGLRQKDLNINNILELCKRIILFTTSSNEKTIHSSSFSLFDKNNNENSESAKNDEKLNIDSVLKFFKKDFKLPQLKFHVQFDDDESWSHLKLAILCLSLFEKHFSQQFLSFDLLLCSFLQAANFNGISDHLKSLNLNEKDLSECESVVLPLLNYHSTKETKKEINIFNSTTYSKSQYNPLLLQSKYNLLVFQMAPKLYLRKLQELFNELSMYQKRILDHCEFMNQINMSKYVVYSTKQNKQFLERQKFQNDSNMRSWRHLWSALSIERAPWHVDSNDGTIFSRDVCACFGLAPVKLRKHLPYTMKKEEEEEEIDDNSESPVKSRFSSKRGIIFDSICYLLVIEEIDDQKRRKKGNFELYKSCIKIRMLENYRSGKVFIIPLSSLKYVFRRPNNGVHFFTEFGFSFHIEFPNEKQKSDNNELQVKIMKIIYQNLMKCPDKSFLLYQFSDNKSFFKILPFLEKWKSGKMSNYEYILMLNHCSGRSFNDISRYPVFPWILNNYTNDPDKLLNSANIRDFSTTPESKMNLTKLAVLTYLNKLEPYKSLFDEFKSSSTDQNNKFCECHSMDEMVNYAKEHNLEFIPEFYSMPEFFSTFDQISSENLTQEKKFVFPLWSNSSPIEFVYNHRKILESPNITAVIHNWFTGTFKDELFECPHPPASVLERERLPVLKSHFEMSLGEVGFVAGIIAEDESPLVFTLKLLNEEGKLYQTKLSLKKLITVTDGNRSTDYNSSSEGYLSDHDEIICDYDNEVNNNNSNNSSKQGSYSIYSNYKKGFHFSFPRINEMESSIGSGSSRHATKKRKISACSSSFNSHFSPDFTRISSFDNLKYATSFTQPELTTMKTPLVVGRLWNQAKFGSSYVTSSDGKFYLARGQYVTAIDLSAKKIHKINISGSTITTLASPGTSTIIENSPSASASTSTFNMTASKVTPKRNSEIQSGINSRDSSLTNLQLNSGGCHQRPRAISAGDSLSCMYMHSPSSRSNSCDSDNCSFGSDCESPRNCNDNDHHDSSSASFNSVRCLAANGIWMAVGRDNASVSLVCNLRSVVTIQSYRSSVSACAVSQTFNILACGTLDGALIIYTKDAGKIIKVVDLTKFSNNIKNDIKNKNIENLTKRNFDVNFSTGGVTPKKIIISPTWGFIVVFCDEIDLGVLKHFVCIFTINGQFIRKVDISIEIDYWACWASYSGFDYIVFVSETGHVFINEVFYMNNKQPLFNCRDRIVTSYFSKETSTLVLVTSGGNVIFIPIEF